MSYTTDVLWVSMLENRVIRRDGDDWINIGIRAKGIIKGTKKAHGSNGGYGKISQAGEWMEIKMYYGFPNYCDEDLKKTFEDYLLLPHTYYEFAKGRMPNKYTEGMGTFEDQAKGFADHFSTTIAGMDVANKHISNNKAINEIKKEDDFVII
nr:hypothetical protein [Tanacetum cinerariifolium]